LHRDDAVVETTVFVIFGDFFPVDPGVAFFYAVLYRDAP
jgi:hypothetical protein